MAGREEGKKNPAGSGDLPTCPKAGAPVYGGARGKPTLRGLAHLPEQAPHPQTQVRPDVGSGQEARRDANTKLSREAS